MRRTINHLYLISILLLGVLVLEPGIVQAQISNPQKSKLSDRLSDYEADLARREARLNRLMQANSTARVVYAVRDLKAGEKIPGSALKGAKVDLSKVYKDAYVMPALVVGKRPKYGIKKGSMICVHDLYVDGESKETRSKKYQPKVIPAARKSMYKKIVFAIQDVKKGAKIPLASLQERFVAKGKVPPDAVSSASAAAGKTAKFKITHDQILSVNDF